MTEITLEARRQAIAVAHAVAEKSVQSGTGAADKLHYQGKDLTLPVVHMDLDYVLLNPASHRIGSFVQSVTPEETALLENDPYGPEAQALVARLIKETDGYIKLRNILSREDQREAGVMTDAGILINANTRAVALRELGKKYIDVVVLPADAGEREFNDIELRLQMAVEGKQAYSFTAQLLFIEDLINSKRSLEEVGQILRPDFADDAAGRKQAKADVELELRLLELVRDVVSLGGGKTRFRDLDARRQALIEIDSDYQSMKNKNRDVADRVKYAQLTAMLSDIDYRKIRAIDDSLLSTYVLPAMEEDETFHGRLDTLLTHDAPTPIDGALTGLDLLDDDDDSSGASFRGLLQLVASAEQDGSIELPATDAADAATVATQVVRNAIYGVFDLALRTKAQDDQSGDTLTAPSRLLLRAARDIDAALAAYEDVRDEPGFDPDAFDSARQRLERAYDSLVDSLDEQLTAVPDPA